MFLGKSAPASRWRNVSLWFECCLCYYAPMRRTLILSGVLLTLFAGAAAVRPLRQYVEWVYVRTTQKPDQLRWFIAACPDSPHAEQARLLLDAMAWKQAEQSYQQEGYEEYLKQWPNGVHATDAKAKIEKLAMMRKLSLLSGDERAVLEKECNVLKQTNERLTKLIGKCVDLSGIPVCTGGPLSGDFTKFIALSGFVQAAGEFAGNFAGGNKMVSEYTSLRSKLENAGVPSLIQQGHDANLRLSSTVKRAESRTKESFGNTDAVCSLVSSVDGSVTQ